MSDYRPLFGIQQALKRVTRDGRECGPQERVDLAAALWMYTINGAYGSFEDDAKGSLEPGKAADLVLLGHDIASVSVDEIAGIPVLMTMVDGHAVYGSGGVPV